MNVTEIEKQSQATAENISKIDEKLDALPLTEIALIEQYEEEKKVRMKLNGDVDYVQERAIENVKLFPPSKLDRFHNHKNIDQRIETASKFKNIVDSARVLMRR